MTSEEIERNLAEMHAASFAWALGRGGWKRDEAEEVLQSSYVKVLDGRARFDGRSSLKTWFFAVIRKTAAEERRKRLFREMFLSRLVAWWTPRASQADAESLADETFKHDRLAEALGSLSARQREVLELVFYHDFTIEEAAEAMGVSIGSARAHYERGKRALRERLGSALRSEGTP